jgi:hypothetical protein
MATVLSLKGRLRAMPPRLPFEDDAHEAIAANKHARSTGTRSVKFLHRDHLLRRVGLELFQFRAPEALLD